jgi:DNA repair ATPase RecN
MPWFLRSLKTTSGFLENAPITFSNRLTCIIGSRGTCKSTIIETIRFVLDDGPERIKSLLEDGPENSLQSDLPSPKGLIRASLKDGIASCEFVDSSAEEEGHIVLERTPGAGPRVFREGVEQVDEHVPKLAEIYSQGDLHRIAGTANLRLQLVDRPNQDKVKVLLRRRDDSAARLRAMGPEIKRLRADVDSRRNTTRGLDSYRSDLDELQANRPQLSPELNEERENYLVRKELVEGARRVLDARAEVISALEKVVSRKEGMREQVTMYQRHSSEVVQNFGGMIVRLHGLLDQIHEAVYAIGTEPVAVMFSELESWASSENQRYFLLRRQEQEISDVLRREDVIKNEISRMVFIEKEVSELEIRLAKSLAERKQLRAQIEEVADELYKLRIDQIQEINSAFGEVVLLTLKQGNQSAEYRSRIGSLLEGSRLRNQDEVAGDLAKFVLPSDLIDTVEAGDARRLSDLLQRDLGQMTRLVGYLIDNPKLYEQIEGLTFDDSLEITMFISGEPKPIGKLSKGQMATALLPLILRPAPYPLVFDQPEDDLDNAFVFTTLIERVRELKSERQIIFVTHNANIPVLGDAETVVVMSMKTPHKANVPVGGDVNEVKSHILTLLEGGAEAFKRRKEKYGELIEEGA